MLVRWLVIFISLVVESQFLMVMCYISTAVCINDKASMVFGGSDDPLALGTLTSIGKCFNHSILYHSTINTLTFWSLLYRCSVKGAINVSTNGKIQSGVTDALEPYGVTAGRIYINFFDMPRENVGWNRATFGG